MRASVAILNFQTKFHWNERQNDTITLTTHNKDNGQREHLRPRHLCLHKQGGDQDESKDSGCRPYPITCIHRRVYKPSYLI
jgi:hypothetical protein